MNWTIDKLTKELNLPFRTIARFVKRFKPELKKYIRVGKNNEFEMNNEGKNRLTDLISSESNRKRGIHIKVELDELVGDNEPLKILSSPKTSVVENNVAAKKTEIEKEVVKKKTESKVDVRSINEAIAANLIMELKQKNALINNMMETHAKERERADTIIMKLMHDIEKIRNENRNFIDMKPSENNIPCRGDSGMSMERYIEVLADNHRELFQKPEPVDPMAGMSQVKKLCVKVFMPYKLRKLN